MTSRIASPGRWSASLTLLALTALLPGCGDDKKDGASAGGSGNGTAGATSTAGKSSGTGGGGNKPIGSTGKSSAADVARKLGHEANFLIGMGADLPDDYKWEHSLIYTLGTALDIHYVYLSYGWEKWNEGGTFAQEVAKVDMTKKATPMSTVYAIAGRSENNFDVLVDDSYMTPYWDAAKVLMTRYAELNTPAIVHLEPDFWAYGQQKSKGDPSTVPAHLHPDCKDLPNNLSGMARCWIQLARDNAPKVLVGLHASEWGGGSGTDVGEFLNKLGAAESDLVVIDILDRDAGCFEAKGKQCTREGKFYLDETNATSPNYAERLDFAKQVSTATGKPILWWQLPLGVPSDKPGGTPGHYRDNKVHYVFSHVQELIDAGSFAATFGGGAEEQTSVATDGGQFDKAAKAYYAAPVALP